MQHVQFAPAQDVLGQTAALTENLAFPLMGVPMTLHSNSRTVVDIAERVFGRWQQLPPESIQPISPCRIQIVVHASERHDATRTFDYRVHGPTFLASNGSTLLMAQMDRGEALGFVTPELVQDTTYFQHTILLSLTLQMVLRRDRHPIHAAAVERNGCGVLLVGRSGAGKSTLCYACVREGFRLVEEDAVFVSLEGEARIWGKSSGLHLMPDAPAFFPELSDQVPTQQPNGKWKITVDLAEAGQEKLCMHIPPGILCVLDRHQGAGSRLEPIDSQTTFNILTEEPESGFDLNQRLDDVASVLAGLRTYRFVVGSDLSHAVGVLRSLTDSMLAGG